MSRSILAIEALMKPSASSNSWASVFVIAGFAVGGGGAQLAQARDQIVAQGLQLAREAHDVDQRRAQVVANDVGEALDLLVGLQQLGLSPFALGDIAQVSREMRLVLDMRGRDREFDREPRAVGAQRLQLDGACPAPDLRPSPDSARALRGAARGTRAG